jgi:hypothetical protein
MAESGSLYIATVVTNIFQLPSKVAGKDPKKVDPAGYAQTHVG